MAKRDLKSLLSAVAHGDRPAFRALFDATSAKLFAVAVRIVKRRDLAEDVVQDAYLKIWQRAGEYASGSGAPMTWMATIVRNRAIDVLRKRTEMPLPGGEAGMALAGEEPDPFALAEQSAALEALLACMSELEPAQQRPVLLAYYYGYTYEEIAEAMAAPASTIKSRVRRALIKIRDCLSDEG